MSEILSWEYEVLCGKMMNGWMDGCMDGRCHLEERKLNLGQELDLRRAVTKLGNYLGGRARVRRICCRCMNCGYNAGMMELYRVGLSSGVQEKRSKGTEDIQ